MPEELCYPAFALKEIKNEPGKLRENGNKKFREAQFICSYWSPKQWFFSLHLFELKKTVKIWVRASAVYTSVAYPGFCNL